MWSEEEKQMLYSAWRGSFNSFEAECVAVATRAVELVAARAGTMTAETVEQALDALPVGYNRGIVREHITALGARLAVAEHECDDFKLRLETALVAIDGGEALAEQLRKERDEARRQADAISANLAIACRKADDQRERAEMAEREISEAKSDYRRAFANAKTYLARAEGAEARLQRMRDGVTDMVKRCVEMAKVAGEPSRAAPEAPPCTCNMLQRDTQWHDSDCPRSPVVKRYPCSPTCTHDDAETPGHSERVRVLSTKMRSLSLKTPGHPERVASLSERMRSFPDVVDSGASEQARERSEAFTQARMDSGHTMTAKGCGQCAPDAKTFTVSATSAASLANGYVRASDTAALFGAQTPDGHPISMARREGFNNGAEVMRAACLTDVLEMYRKQGGCVTEQDLKSAIEGAAP